MRNMNDPIDLRARQKADKEDADRQRAKTERDDNDFRWLMGDRRGRRIVWAQLEDAGVYRSSFRLNNEMAFLEGQRNHGLKLMDKINRLCPELYPVMLKEQEDDRSNSEQQRRT